MSNPLFSTYTQGENRVTATILSVFERLSFNIVEQIFKSLIEESSTSLLSFQNQSKGNGSVPDGEISASFSYLIETKIKTKDVNVSQLKNHLTLLERKKYKQQHLILLTPDTDEPSELKKLEDSELKKITWVNFDALLGAIEGVVSFDDFLSNDQPITTENERELLRELTYFLTAEELLDKSENKVIVVPAKSAYPEYLKNGFYFCQPNRSFQPSSHLGFYCDGEIKPKFPNIYRSIENTKLEVEYIKQHERINGLEEEKLIKAIKKFDEHNIERQGDEAKVLFLSSPDSEDTLTIDKPIVNTEKSKTGKNTAFTQFQRYVTTDALKRNPATTSELLKLMDK